MIILRGANVSRPDIGELRAGDHSNFNGNIEVFMDFVVRKAVELHYSNEVELLKTREVARNIL